jgi:hypothetical protein
MDGLWLGSYWLDTRINSLAAAVSAASIAAVSCYTVDSRISHLAWWMKSSVKSVKMVIVLVKNIQ